MCVRTTLHIFLHTYRRCATGFSCNHTFAASQSHSAHSPRTFCFLAVSLALISSCCPPLLHYCCLYAQFLLNPSITSYVVRFICVIQRVEIVGVKDFNAAIAYFYSYACFFSNSFSVFFCLFYPCVYYLCGGVCVRFFLSLKFFITALIC